MRHFALPALIATSVLVGTGCHPRSTVVTTTSAAVGGTLAGVVHGPTDASLSDRNVSIVNVETGERYQTVTGPNGGFALRVPPGAYRLEVQLRDREKLSEDNPTIMIRADGDTERPVDVNIDP